MPMSLDSNRVIQRRAVEDAPEASFDPSVNALLQRIYRARGLYSDSDISLSLQDLLSPTRLQDLDKALDLLYESLQQESLILVVGDFDADGATSCALLLRVLKAFGHRNAQFLVPNRFEYGYGLTPPIVDIAARQNPHLIVTVDNGISSIDGVARAQELGIKVLVTDHHLPGTELPAADAIVNPNMPGCKFESKALAGVGVVFYLMAALRGRLVKEGWFAERNIDAPVMADYLDLVALGTVADVVPLDRNNRILVEQGLRRIRSGRCCAGIRALIRVTGRSAASLTASDIGFALGPRLNAAGRLDDISIGIGMLLTDDESLAGEIATELDALNRDRRQIEASMQKEAEEILGSMTGLDGNNSNNDKSDAHIPKALSLFNENWHQGVVGILASRLKDRHHRPVICFAPATDNPGENILKGSARSIQGFQVRDALESLSTQHPGLIEKFGGHAMAAGLSIQRSRFDEFSRHFDALASELLSPEDLHANLLSDGELETNEMTLLQAEQLKTAQPWGQKLPEPVFDGVFRLVQQRLVGQRHLRMQLSLDDPGNVMVDAIAFNVDTDIWPDHGAEYVRIAYSLDVNEYRGQRSLQLLIKHLEMYSLSSLNEPVG